MGDSACIKCKQKLNKRDKIYVFACDSCKTCYCGDCSELTTSEVRCMLLAERQLKFFCKYCRENDYIECLKKTILDKTTIINEKQKMIDMLQEQIKRIESTRPYASFAEVASSINRNQKPPKDIHVSHLKTLIVKPKQQQDIKTTSREIKLKINPALVGAPIKYYKETKSGQIVIKSDTIENLENLSKHATQVLGNNYELNIKEQENPKIKIVGLKNNYQKGEDLIAELKVLNRVIDEKDKIKITYTRQSKKTKKWTVFADTSGATFGKLVNSRLDIGWGWCHVYEDLNIKRCYKCSAFGHKTTECIKEQTCTFCGGNHRRYECEETKPRCSNCIYVNKHYNTNHQIEHDSESEECPILAKKSKLARERINYDSTL